jgi:microcystin-dependent protein
MRGVTGDQGPTGAEGIDPIGMLGMVAYFAHSDLVIPDDGWLECDGTLYNAADYPKLYAVIQNQYGSDGTGTFNVPNLQGRFVRCWNYSSDPSIGGSTPYVQGAETLKHHGSSHILGVTGNHDHTFYGSQNSFHKVNDDTVYTSEGGTQQSIPVNPEPDHQHIISSFGGAETVPYNFVLNAYICWK